MQVSKWMRSGVAAVLAPAALVAQGAAVTSASLTIQRKPVNAVTVSVTNHDRHSIAAISLVVRPKTGGGGGQDVDFHFTGHLAGAAPLANAVILPNETRSLTVRVGTADPATITAIVQGVMFDDGRVEGNAAARREFSTMLSPPGLPPPPPMPDPPDSAVTSATAATRPGAAIDIVAIVRNLRSVPIRALTVTEYWDRAMTGSSNAHSSWLCSDATSSGNGLIQPGETREIRVNGADTEPNNAMPFVTLAAVLWEDQKAEGSVAGRDQLIKMRATNGCR